MAEVAGGAEYGDDEYGDAADSDCPIDGHPDVGPAEGGFPYGDDGPEVGALDGGAYGEPGPDVGAAEYGDDGPDVGALGGGAYGDDGPEVGALDGGAYGDAALPDRVLVASSEEPVLVGTEPNGEVRSPAPEVGVAAVGASCDADAPGDGSVPPGPLWPGCAP